LVGPTFLPGLCVFRLHLNTFGASQPTVTHRHKRLRGIAHWAHRNQDRFPDGQLYVNLRGYDPGAPLTAAEALDQVLQAFRRRARDIPADVEARAALYRSLVADRRILVLLDNAATGSQVRPLLPGSSGCLVLVTSRQRLPGLAVRDGARRVSIGPLSEDDAVELVQGLTAEYRRGDEPRELRELVRLCARLPLALRIAAERAASRARMPLAELIEDLRDESSLWEALSTDDDEEASAVRTVFAWSYRALPPDAARLFRLLGLHPGAEFSVAAAAALTDTGVREVRSSLDALAGAHLIEEAGPDRYQFHDLLRHYAVDQVARDEAEVEQQVALRRVLHWYLHSARAAVVRMGPPSGSPVVPDPVDPQVTPMSFADYDAALHWYDSERDNLITATGMAARTGFDNIAWQIPTLLNTVSGDRDAVGTWLEAQQVALAAARRAGERHGEALVLETLGIQYRLANRLVEAAQHYAAASSVFQQVGDETGEARSLLGLGLVHRRERHLDEARARLEPAVAIAEGTGDELLLAALLRTLGCVHLDFGELTAAEELLRRARAIFAAEGHRLQEAMTSRFLGAVQSESGRLIEARESLDLTLELARDLENSVVEAAALLEIGRLELASGSAEDCLETSQRAAALFRRLGHPGHEAQAIQVTGDAYRQLKRVEDAVAFHRRAVAMHRALGDRWQLAVALVHLADVLDQAGQTTESHSARTEASSLSATVAGPRADSLRARLVRELDSDTSG
jgi:tetratricopeptide (TPR) repeat protein